MSTYEWVGEELAKFIEVHIDSKNINLANRMVREVGGPIQPVFSSPRDFFGWLAAKLLCWNLK